MLSFIPHNQDKWDVIQFAAHKAGITCIGWAPYTVKKGDNLPLGQQANSAEERKEEPLPMRFASGGIDGVIKFWTFNHESRKFEEEIILARPEWIKDLAFAQQNTMGISLAGYSGIEDSSDTLAICSDKTGVAILSKEGDKWEEYRLPMHKAAATKVGWGVDRSNLAVAYEDGSTKTFEEKEHGKWDEIVTEELKEAETA